jgi:adenylate cyclase
VALKIRAKRRWLAAASAAAAGLVGILLSVLPLRLTEQLDNVIYDALIRRAADPGEARPDIVLVDVDDASFEWVDRELGEAWPWPREFHGVMAVMLRQWGARVVGFDFFFDQVHHGRLDDTLQFAEALETAGSVVLAAGASAAAPRPFREPGLGLPLRTHDSPDAALRDATAVGAQLLSPFLVEDAGRITVYAAGYETESEAVGHLAQRRLLIDAFRPDLISSETADRAAFQAALDEAVRDALIRLPDAARPFDPRATVADRFAIGRLADAGWLAERLEVQPDAILPVPSLLPVTRAIGFADQIPDADGVLRRAVMVQGVGAHLYPTLPLALVLAAEGERADWPAVTVEGGRLRVGERVVPLDRDGRALLRFHGERPYRKVPAWEVLHSASRVMFEDAAPVIDTTIFEDAIVIVAPVASALMDFKPTPLSPRHLGPDIVAIATDNLLTGRWIRRVSPWTEAVWSVLLAVLAVSAAAFAGAWVSPARSSGLSGALRFAGRALLSLGGAVVCVWGGLLMAWLLVSGPGIWPGVAAPLFSAGLGVALFLTGGELLERRDRRHIHDALGSYTSRAVADLVASEGVEALAPRRADVSVYFSDIASFTSFSEKMEPEALAELLNLYLTEMTAIILEHEGIVDKYIGDAIMAFWGAPAPQSDHALRAVTCGLRMQRRLQEITPDLEARYGVKLVVRAGINSGQVAVGNMGSAQKVNYTLMGDTVNLAARLEGANKPYDTYLMVGEDTWKQVFFAVVGRELDLLRVKGKDKPVRVYEPLAMNDALPDDWEAWIARYEEALELYRSRRFEEATEAFEEVIALRGHDGPSRVYLERCAQYRVDPPPEDWDGVYVMTSK